MKHILPAILLLSFTTPALAAESKLDSSHKAWSVFSTTENSKKVCYITSTPEKEEGTFSRRGEPYALVTLRPGNPVEASFSSGFPYKDNSEVEVTVPKHAALKFFTSAETPKVAWAKSEEEDKKLINAMKNGDKITVKGTSPKKTHAIDTYSLSGFSAAYNRMIALCK